MAIMSVKERMRGEGRITDKGVRHYTRVYLVVTDSFYTRSQDVVLAAGIPRVYQPYITPTEQDPGALCKTVTARQNQTIEWEVTAEYSSEVENPDKFPENPLERPAKWRWSMQRYQKAIDQCVLDLNETPNVENAAILNSAMEKFDPPPEIDASHLLLSISRAEPSFVHDLALHYQDAVNDDTFLAENAGTVKMQSITGSDDYENGVYFWNVTYEMEFRRGGWDLELLDRGYSELIAGVPFLLRDANSGQPLSAPTLLNGSGRKLNLADADPVFRRFRIYRRKNFADLNLT